MGYGCAYSILEAPVDGVSYQESGVFGYRVLLIATLVLYNLHWYITGVEEVEESSLSMSVKGIGMRLSLMERFIKSEQCEFGHDFGYQRQDYLPLWKKDAYETEISGAASYSVGTYCVVTLLSPIQEKFGRFDLGWYR